MAGIFAKTGKGKCYLFFLMAFLYCVILPAYSTEVSDNDFSILYYAARVITSADHSPADVYAYHAPGVYGTENDYPYTYSVLAAHLVSPLALMPFRAAKLLWSVLVVLFYFAAYFLSLRIIQPPARYERLLVLIAPLWIPFLVEARQTQSDSLMFLLVVLAVLAAVRGSPYFSGSLLALAALFKLWPIAVAMVFGLKNWRVFVACMVVFGASFLVPGSPAWFGSLLHTSATLPRPELYSPVLILLKGWFWLYLAVIPAVTALLVWRYPETDYPLMLSISLAAVFLIMPVNEYFHYVPLIFPLIYLLGRIPLPYVGLLYILLCAVTPRPLNVVSAAVFCGLYLIWGTLAYCMVKKKVASPAGSDNELTIS